ncbi:MAG TPA: neutral/alkaline non-lysosomal ceramidase N-terminal domain-containing protein [Thermoanaerobaculia bacterium]|nr:neutral/alkaline non-lysosomal ceramidase N-terminal domain-containing protein [Thermoanaerobaculia bacterium]
MSKLRLSPARLSLLLALAAPLAGSSPLLAELRAGTARADITPPLGSQLYGYGARGQAVSTAVHDPLFAKALALSDGENVIAIVNLDLGSFGKPYANAVRSRVRAASGIEHLLLVASHTHSAPRFDEAFPSPEHPWLRELEEKVANAVIAASADLEPALLRIGQGALDGCHNRRRVLEDGTVLMRWANRGGEPTSPLDPRVTVLAVDRADGSAIATLVGFTCHPVVLGPENLEISADYPGAMMAAVESATGGQAMFLQGAAGDTNPNWDKTPPAEGGFERMQELGRALAGEVLRVRPGAHEVPAGPIATRRRIVRLEPRWDLESPEVREVFVRQGGDRLYDYYRQRFAIERDAEITSVLIGPSLGLAFFPGEFFVEHGLRLRTASHPLVPHALFVGYTNGELGYFPTIEAAAQGGYGATEGTLVEVGAGEKLVDRALIDMLEMAGKLRALPGA